MFLLGGFALRVIELRSARMVSPSSVVIPVNIVSLLATKSIVGRVTGVIELFIQFSSSSLSSSVMLKVERLMTHFDLPVVVVVCSLISFCWLSFSFDIETMLNLFSCHFFSFSRSCLYVLLCISCICVKCS